MENLKKHWIRLTYVEIGKQIAHDIYFVWIHKKLGIAINNKFSVYIFTFKSLQIKNIDNLALSKKEIML